MTGTQIIPPEYKLHAGERPNLLSFVPERYMVAHEFGHAAHRLLATASHAPLVAVGEWTDADGEPIGMTTFSLSHPDDGPVQAQPFDLLLMTVAGPAFGFATNEAIASISKSDRLRCGWQLIPKLNPELREVFASELDLAQVNHLLEFSDLTELQADIAFRQAFLMACWLDEHDVFTKLQDAIAALVGNGSDPKPVVFNGPAILPNIEPHLAELRMLAEQPGLFKSAEVADQVLAHVQAFPAPADVDSWVMDPDAVGAAILAAGPMDAVEAG